MTNREILEKAMLKAMDGGWSNDVQSYSFVGNKVNFELSETTTLSLSYPEIIYNHIFAKALWGEGLYIRPAYQELEPPRDIHPWKYHLMHMVISDDPIKYLGENL